ncbi:hypothetical protein CS542_05550 [Pedobacter sp. IW39]|nr:hypothetical protein CS542_05550 [Pedobacter sp. IW39]
MQGIRSAATEPTLSFSDSGARSGKQVPHLFVTAGYKFLNEEVSVTPSVMFKSPACAFVSRSEF